MTDRAGSFTAELSGELDVGRPNQQHVLKVLAGALRQNGHNATLGVGPQDDRGEDGIIFVDGHRIGVQIVSLPMQSELWRRLRSQELASRRGTQEDAVELIRSCLLRKKGTVAGMLLALDASHFGALVTSAIVDAYVQKYGDAEQELSVFQTWLVGPTNGSTLRLCSGGG